MVSYHDAWSKGMAMLAVGIQTNLLQGSMAIGMSKDEAKRKVQISKNEQLFQEGLGHLAPLTGQERSLVVTNGPYEATMLKLSQRQPHCIY